MELGLDFDDSDFADKVREKTVLTSYNAKVCHNEWFLSPKADNGKNDPATLYKFRADYHYNGRKWDEAIDCYKQVLASLGSQNRTMRREVQECMIRCYIHTKHFTRALQDMQLLIADCITIDHLTQALVLKHSIYRAAGLVNDEILVLHQLIDLHSVNAFFWNTLGKAYENFKNLTFRNCSPKEKKNEEKHHKNSTEFEDNGGSRKDRYLHESYVRKKTLVENLPDAYETVSKTDHSCSPVKTLTETIDKVDIDNDSEVKKRETENTRQDISGVLDLNVYPLKLVLLTCYTRTRLILMSTNSTVGTFIKQKNEQLTRQLEDKISRLNVTEEEIEAADQFMRQEMFFEDEQDESSTSDQICDATVILEKGITVEEFNKKWFGWINDFKAS